MTLEFIAQYKRMTIGNFTSVNNVYFCRRSNVSSYSHFGLYLIVTASAFTPIYT